MSENHKRLESNPLMIWLLKIDQITPPFYLEMVLADGSLYSAHSLNACDGLLGLAIVQIGDFSSLIDQELNKLRLQSLSLTNADILRNPTELDEKLERTFLRFRTGNIGLCVEGHSNPWPKKKENHNGY